MTLEIRLVDRAKKALEKAGAFAIKTHGSSLRQGEPDIFCCFPYRNFGLTVVIEMKVPGEEPRPLQLSRLRRWARAGAIAFWSDDPDEILPIIRREIEAREAGTTTLENGRPK